jgi:hypothetical protein
MNFTPRIPPGCVDIESHEARLTQLADELETRARALMTDEHATRVELATGNQMIATAVKARERAAALAMRRAELEHDVHLMRAARELQGLAPSRKRRGR